MKVELIGLSQGISFEKKQATNYLDFRKDTGDLFRLEVPQTVAEELLSIMLKEEPAPEVVMENHQDEPPAEDFPEEATTFGSDGEDEEPVTQGPMSHIGPSVESEEEVPSL